MSVSCISTSPKAAGFVLLVMSLLLAACSRPEPATEPVRAVRTVVVQPGVVSAERSFAAEVRARTESSLSFQVAGRLVQRLVDVGQVVRAGQPLARIDPQDLRLAQTAAQAAVAAAEVNAAQAASDLRRFGDLHAQGFISAAELQRRETAARAAQAQLAQARAQAEVQMNQAGYGTLLARAAGVVTAAYAEPGAVLTAGQPVLRVAHAGPRDAVFSVPEDEVQGVRQLLGREGALRVRGWGRADDWPATLREVAAAADPTTRTFVVKAALGAAPAELGQTATAVLTLPPRDGLIRLPLSAVRELGGRAVVWQLDPQAMTVSAREIQITGADGNLALVGAGLAPGAEVVTAGVHVLSEGQQVTRFAQAAVQ